MLAKTIVIFIMIAIAASLSVGMYYLVCEGKADSKKVVQALTFRIGLSVSLFGLLIIAFIMGWIQPHGIGG